MESIQKTMPFCFQPHYSLRVTSIIDCFEYKHYNTAKYLISITPQLGIVSFISIGWRGRVLPCTLSSTQDTYKRNLHPGDVVLANLGFDVADSVAMWGATLDILAFTRDCEQLPPADVEATQKLANVRIHVERIIGAVHQRFSFYNWVLQKESISKKSSKWVILDSVVRVCCAVNNVLEGIVPFD